MDSRKILEIYKRINDRNIKFVGAGPIASAPPAANYWGRGGVGPLYYCTDDNKPYVSVRSFHNEGTDFGNWGRPSSLVSLLVPSNAYTVAVIFEDNNAVTNTALLSMSGDSPDYRQLSIQRNGIVGTMAFIVGGPNKTYGAPYKAGFSRVIASNNGSTGYLYKDGGLLGSSAVGSSLYNGNIRITAADGGAANPETNILMCSFYSGFTSNGDISGLSCVACFNANSYAQWDGGATAYDSAGNPITFTDGAPTGLVYYSWLPLAQAQDWGLFS